ncbi:MAG: hypothetical protein K940chlam5_00976 [Candidatus Anoxychlamydiales bacterium]|nr:hypothetical protein [Candidatus Anoxychlamydiales bacterium]
MITNEYFEQYLQTILTLEKQIEIEMQKISLLDKENLKLFIELKQTSLNHQKKINEMLDIVK